MFVELSISEMALLMKNSFWLSLSRPYADCRRRESVIWRVCGDILQVNFAFMIKRKQPKRSATSLLSPVACYMQ
jgi:hypothetical protein